MDLRIMVPSGASTGINETVELRDGDKKRFGGKGVLKAVEHLRTEIAKALKCVDASDQRRIDRQSQSADRGETRPLDITRVPPSAETQTVPCSPPYGLMRVRVC